jgi:hypothetical protein
VLRLGAPMTIAALIVGDAYLNHAAHLAPPPGDHTPPDTPARDPAHGDRRGRGDSRARRRADHATALPIGFVCDALGLDAGVPAAAVRRQLRARSYADKLTTARST